MPATTQKTRRVAKSTAKSARARRDARAMQLGLPPRPKKGTPARRKWAKAYRAALKAEREKRSAKRGAAIRRGKAMKKAA